MRYNLRLAEAFALALFLGSFFALSLGMVSNSEAELYRGANDAQAVTAAETDTWDMRPLCAWRTRDVCAPLVEMTIPNGGEVFRGTELITWDAIPFNGEPLNQDLYYGADGGAEWIIIAVGLRETSFHWDTTDIPDGENYLIRVVVHGEVTGGQDQSDGVFTVDNSGDVSPLSNPIKPELMYTISAVVGIFLVLAVLIVRRI